MEIEMHFSFVIDGCLLPSDKPAGGILFIHGCRVGSQEQTCAIINVHTGGIVGVENKTLHDQFVNCCIDRIIRVCGSLISRFDAGIRSSVYCRRCRIPVFIHKIEVNFTHCDITGRRYIKHDRLSLTFFDMDIIQI